MNYTRNCIVCKKEYQRDPHTPRQKFCSNECKNNYWYSKRTELSRTSFRIPAVTVGAVTELVVSVDLLKKGYEVFRSLSPGCSCDVLAMKNKKVYTLEIRTGYYLSSKKITYSKKNIKADYLVVVTHNDNKVHYFPELE